MRFSVQTSQRYVPWANLLEFWERLDRESGYDAAWLTDHLSTDRGRDADDLAAELAGSAEGPFVEAWTALGALAQGTTRIRLGTLVTSIRYRHPAMLAKMATTVDNISRGRLEFGIGAGATLPEVKRFALPTLSLAEREDRLGEVLQVIKLLWTEQKPVFQGKYYALDRPSFLPDNVQQPHPPILVGGMGERMTLRLVAQYADASNFTYLISPQETRRLFDVLEEHCHDAGRDPRTIRRTVELPLISGTPWEEHMLAALAQQRKLTVDEAHTLLLRGSPAAQRSLISQYEDVGVDEIVVFSFGATDMNAIQQWWTNVLRFSHDVIEAVS